MEIESRDMSTVLAQWQTCVEMANSISQRRDTMNNIFVTLNIAIITAISVMWDVKTIALDIVGGVLCVVWILFIRNFGELNKAKFNVILDIENELPIAAFTEEWRKIKESKKYREATRLEKTMPVIFLILYIGLLIIMLILRCH